ncbi:MAG: hypothetical protein HRT89_14115, partial [Lentisphaeria bacterium]|nr:hypothetical protein [Lentisphaeria bacterium]
LTPEQIAEVCAIGLKIEDYFGKPQDIEWGWIDGSFALLQTRAIRGLDIVRDVEVGRLAEIDRLKKLTTDKRQVWVTHNLGETLRAPMPLTWDIMQQFMSGDGGFGRFYHDLGYRPSPLVCKEGFLELIGGRIYADPERAAQLFWGDSPFCYDLDALIEDQSILDQAPDKFEPNNADGAFFLIVPGIIATMWRKSRIGKQMKKTVEDHFKSTILPPYLAYVKGKRAQDLTALNTADLCAELEERRQKVLVDFAKESLKPGSIGAIAFAELRNTLIQLMGEEEGGKLAFNLTVGLDGDTTVDQNEMLYQVAHGKATMADFLELYGHRTVGEMELSEPRYREDPTQLDNILTSMKKSAKSPGDLHHGHIEERTKLEKELPELLVSWGGSSLQEKIQENLKLTQELLAYRESGKYYLMMGYELIRLAILEFSRRWDLGRDIFFLQIDELAGFEGRRDELLETIAARKIRWQSLQRLDMADVIDSDELDKLGLPQVYENATELEGEAIAAGVASGTARIVFDPRESRDLGEDCILVCTSTDPGWTPLFVNARALIVEKGGVLSHGAIVARDFGIPAVVCAGATKRLKEGDKVRVDGNRGIISIMESDNA